MNFTSNGKNAYMRTIDKEHFTSFMQKGSSSDVIPGYNSPVINGSGYTFNPLPQERYHDAQDNVLYKNKA